MNAHADDKINSDFITRTLLQDEVNELRTYVGQLEIRLDTAMTRQDYWADACLFWRKEYQKIKAKIEFNDD